MLSKSVIKIWARSGSRKFLQDDRAPFEPNRAPESYLHNRKPVFYRVSSSDPALIYNILLKADRKAEYWIPEGVNHKVILDLGGNIGTTSVCFTGRFLKDAGIKQIDLVKQISMK